MPPKDNPNSFLSLQLGKLRRAWLVNFRPGYVRAQQARKRGACRQCGNCCRLGFRCPFLKRDNTCVIYRLLRARNCRLFPIDDRDIRDAGGECGFYFVEKPEPVEAREPPR